MSFRKRNIVVASSSANQVAAPQQPEKKDTPGVRPSPFDGRPTISTGTSSLDALLAGHAGLPLGTSLLIEEHGTTDFGGVLLKYYCAEGLVQGHTVHALGLHPRWKNELPGLSVNDAPVKSEGMSSEKIKIAWRYEALSSNGGARASQSGTVGSQSFFRHNFSLKKRLAKEDIKGELLVTDTVNPVTLDLSVAASKGTTSLLRGFIATLCERLDASTPNTIHRVIVPGFLLPILYPPNSCRPSESLQFLHALRALLRRYPTQLSAMITLPLTLFPRSTGLTTWMEHLCDGVMELSPITGQITVSKADEKKEDQMQGLFTVHTLPIYHERGGGGLEGHAARENFSFSLSASQGIIIKPYALPPAEIEQEDKKGIKKDSLDF